MLARGIMSWRSVKQILRISSTIWAKFIALCSIATHAMWLKNFIFDSIFKPLKIYCDNNSTVFFIKNNKTIFASKHIRIKFF